MCRVLGRSLSILFSSDWLCRAITDCFYSLNAKKGAAKDTSRKTKSRIVEIPGHPQFAESLPCFLCALRRHKNLEVIQRH